MQEWSVGKLSEPTWVSAGSLAKLGVRIRLPLVAFDCCSGWDQVPRSSDPVPLRSKVRAATRSSHIRSKIQTSAFSWRSSSVAALKHHRRETNDVANINKSIIQSKKCTAKRNIALPCNDNFQIKINSTSAAHLKLG